MKRPRLLLISVKDLEGPGYVGRYHHLVEQFSKYFDVYLFNARQPWKQRDRSSSEWEADEFTEETAYGYPISVQDGYLNELVNIPFNLIKVRRLITKHDIDVVVNGFNFPLGMTTPLWRQGRPVVFDLSDYLPDVVNQSQISGIPRPLRRGAHGAVKAAQEFAFRRSSVVASNTARLTEYADDVSGVEAKLFSNAVDTELFKPITSTVRKDHAINEDAMLFGYGGTITDYAFDFTGMLNGFELLAADYDDVHLMIIGDGTDRESLERTVVDRGLEDVVTFTGSVSYYELPKYYSALDVGLIPRRLDGSFLNQSTRDLKLFEYLACETPTMATPVLEMTDHVFPGEDPPFIRFVSFPEGFKAEGRAFAEQAQEGDIGARGRERVIAEFDWDVVGDQFSAFISDTLLDDR